MAIIKLNNNALTSVTELPSGVGADPNVKVDLARLGLRVFANQNLASTSSNSIFYDVFQDSTGISANTNAPRSTSGEFIATVSETVTNFTPTLHKYSTYTGSVGTPTFGEQVGSTQHNAPANGQNQYAGTMINELWDISQDFTCRAFITNTDNSGSLHGITYMASGMLITTNTSLTAGSDPDIFETPFTTTWYANSNNWSDVLTSAGDTGVSVGSWGSDFGTGNSNRTLDLSSTGKIIGHYYNDGGSDEAGFQVVNDRSANTIVMKSINTSGNPRSEGIVTLNNTPTTGRVLIAFGDASSNKSREFSTSYATSTQASGENSSKTSVTANATGNFTSSTITAPSSVSKLSAVITYKDNAGTNALNTDFTLQLSADNGSNFSTATLTALPDFATGVKCCKVTDLSVTAGTQVKYKISFANQALGSKECRITGVSIQF